MDFIQAFALAFLQGLTEFLPVSSSAHLILMPVIFGWEDQGQAFDVAVHIGTLFAVVSFYRKDIVSLVGAWLASVTKKQNSEESRLAWAVILATIPVGLVGISISEDADQLLRSPVVIAVATIVFAVLLGWSSRQATETRVAVTLKDALIVGSFQALALIPGTSRSGITITAGLLLGLTRNQAARFSFLLSIPVIVLAGLLKSLELYHSSAPVVWEFMLVGVVVSALVAYLSIGWFLTFLEKVGVMPFIWYRLILGIVLLVVFIP
ncbi:MAG TPA: undecaprenyl-diphosphate phosphatase [Methylococcaceae bacterium]|nr:undecaprenyl-diphosphate phosphatase [Methylococcaceae bacterium]